MWEEVKRNIYQYRSGTMVGEPLLALSEAYFEQANNTVFAAEDYSSAMTRQLLLIMLVTWAFIFWLLPGNCGRLKAPTQSSAT